MTLIKMTEQEWIEKYKPLQEDGYIRSFETYGEDKEFVKKQDSNKIWTEMTGDDGCDFISSGWHYVNRLLYYITEVPFDENDTIEILIWTAEEMQEDN